jgi:hypothetical protein
MAIGFKPHGELRDAQRALGPLTQFKEFFLLGKRARPSERDA